MQGVICYVLQKILTITNTYHKYGTNWMQLIVAIDTLLELLNAFDSF